jgi:hypothetical protein
MHARNKAFYIEIELPFSTTLVTVYNFCMVTLLYVAKGFALAIRSACPKGLALAIRSAFLKGLALPLGALVQRAWPCH